MRVLLAPTAFDGTLSAPQAAAAMAQGWADAAPADDLDLCPLSDGGQDLLDVIEGALLRDGRMPRTRAVTVPGPDGRPRPAALLHEAATGTVYLAAADAAGPPSGVGLTVATSRGVATLIEHALDLRPRRIIVGLGTTATHDAGAGLLAGLGVQPATSLQQGGLALADVPALHGLPQARAAFAGTDLVVACREAGLPLLGLAGTSATTATDRGATPEQGQALEAAVGAFAARAQDGLGLVGRDLLGGGAPLSRLPGAGAGGGLGFALALLGATVRPGPEVVGEEVGLAERVAAADLVVVGEGCFDWRSLRDSVPAVVAGAALRTGVPVIVVAGQVAAGRRESTSMGVEATYAVAGSLREVPAALADPAGTLTARTARVARTWSR